MIRKTINTSTLIFIEGNIGDHFAVEEEWLEREKNVGGRLSHAPPSNAKNAKIQKI